MRRLPGYDYRPERDWLEELKWLVFSIFVGTMVFCILMSLKDSIVAIFIRG